MRYLKRWLSAHREASPFHLVYYGQVDPRLLGIEFTLPPTGAVSSHRTEGKFDEEHLPLPGWYGIDVNHLQGTDRPAADGKGGWVCFPAHQFRHFQQFEPVAMVGYSIYIYHITPDDANRVRRELGLPELPGDRTQDDGEGDREGA